MESAKPPIWIRVLPKLKQDKFYMELHRRQKAVEMHDHAFLELTYILEGEVEHTLDGQTSRLCRGDYLIVDYGSRHAYSAVGAEGFDNLDCLFLPELLDPVLKGTESLRALLEHYLLHFNVQALLQNPAHMVFHDDTGRILELLERIRTEGEQRAAGYTEIIRCYLIEILILTVRRMSTAQIASSGQSVSDYLSAYVAEHYMENLTLRELAVTLNYSLPYISKRFKEDTGISFVHYLQSYRIMQACRLLSSTKKTVAEITELVGYRDVKFFSALFKRTMGMSPADFRRQKEK